MPPSHKPSYTYDSGKLNHHKSQHAFEIQNSNYLVINKDPE